MKWKFTKTTVKNLETGQIFPKLKFGKLRRPRCYGQHENFWLYVAFVCKTWLPKDVQLFVRKNCIFHLFSDKIGGTMIPPSEIWPELLVDEKERKKLPPSRPKWLILINQSIPDSRSIYFTITHEIAHAWLRHEIYSSPKREREVDKLVQSWGVPDWY